ncbi:MULTISPECIES: SspB family protein [Thalassobaculum]|uniref:Stringent starvation protein B n=1 Tax=Thalassobaculum litoreum DSM 18839 TaxID=1123362 RepID=A0A8G2BI40_9PROT|nr:MULTISPECIES: ClpXP protease specificity-enhancing factor SspB [Thalassobaculum]SDF44017.1 hypothetical protein SAMN05660686_01357 [Thalassobaculum litoreum DSM 18839]
MADDLFRYDLMVETALRGVVRDALRRAAERGLPGNHHFYITFKTSAPGVHIPAYLVERYPDEMTIVLQFQFWDLEILEDQFSVTLSFNDIREPLTIPFEALTGFADPSVQFGLQFQQTADGETPTGDDDDPSGGDTPDGEDEAADDDAGTGEVVSLDQFRKKK